MTKSSDYSVSLDGDMTHLTDTLSVQIIIPPPCPVIAHTARKWEMHGMN
jgi:hypothetical protein